MMYACVRTTEPQSLQRGERTVVAADEAGPPPPPPSAVQTASATWSRGRCWWPAPPAQQTIKPLSLFPSTAVQSAPQHCLGQCHSVSHSTARASATLSPATLSGPVPLCLPQHCPVQCHVCFMQHCLVQCHVCLMQHCPVQCHSVSCNTVRSSATLSHATLSAEDRTIQYVSRDCFVLCPFTPTTLARLLRLSSLSSSSCNVHVCLTL